MPRLILMRHAKSSWDDPLLHDHDRPLNDRGRRDAATMGEWLKRKDYIPDEIILSTSARTRETMACVCAAAEISAPAREIKELYHANDFTILRNLAKATEDTVMVIAHNPGIGDFAGHFIAEHFAHRDFLRYPTSATTIFDVDVPDWSRVKFGSGKVLDFDIPRHLS